MRFVKKRLDEEEQKRNLRLGMSEGSATTVMSILTDTYLTPFAIALGANSVHIGFLNSMSGLLPPVAQVYGSHVMEKRLRKKVMVASAAWQGLMVLPMLVLGLFAFGKLSSYLLILFYSLYVVFGAVAGLSWFSMMGDIVPENQRGRYFGKRNALLSGVGIVVSLLASFFLDYYKAGGKVLVGFSILFFVAFAARFVSLIILQKFKDPNGKPKKLHEGFWQFFGKMRSTNYGRFVIYVALLNFAAMIASPFFSVYMLEELNLSYTMYVIINLSQSVSMLIFMLIWGKFADVYGNRVLLVIGNILIPLLPLLWIFNQNSYYLFIPMFLGGIGWAAFSLASSNFVYDAVPRDKRAVYLAYLNVLAGVGIFAGSILGGLLIRYLPIRFMNVFLFVFLISAVARALVAIVVLPMVKEERKVQKFSLARVAPLLHLRMLGHHTTLTHNTHVGHQVMHHEETNI